jgi:predicted ester cyclase
MREWFADYLEACNRHDLEALRSLIAPAVRRAHRPGGAEAWIAELAELFAAFPDWRWKRIQLVIEEDRIAAHLRASGTHTGAYRGIAPTRRHVNVAEFGFLRLAKGRVVESTGSAADEVLAQIG